MSRFTFIVVALFAMLIVATAQSSSSSSPSSSTGLGGESSLSSGVVMDLSTGANASSSSSSGAGGLGGSSSSSSEISASSSSSTEPNDTSSSGLNDLSSSSEGFESSSSSGGLGNSSSSSGTYDVVPPYVPSNWTDIDVLSNNSAIVVSWGNKSPDNLMYSVGGTEGFIVNGGSGQAIRLGYGSTYNLTIDSLAAPYGFYIDVTPQGDNPAGNVTVPITVAGSYNFTVNATSISGETTNNNVVFLYYASNSMPFAGGAAIIGTQSAAALQASIMVIAISAFFALVAPKW